MERITAVIYKMVNKSKNKVTWNLFYLGRTKKKNTDGTWLECEGKFSFQTERKSVRFLSDLYNK